MRTQIPFIKISFLIVIFKLQSVTAYFYFSPDRLEEVVHPVKYTIEITPYFLPRDGEKQGTFFGKATIYIVAKYPDVQEFAIHSSGLQFSRVSMYCVEHSEPMNFNYELDEANDKLIFHLDGRMHQFKKHSLIFKFSGKMSNTTSGLFAKKYRDSDGKNQYLVMTLFYPTKARTVFPCFDQPNFKARFEISLICPNGYTSFSNGVIEQVITDATETNRHKDSFQKSPFLSTFQVSMVITKFQQRGVRGIYLITRPEYLNKSDFGLSTAKQILHGYSLYFASPYSSLGSSVMQMITVFNLVDGGVPNWGLSYYNDDILIYDEDDDMEMLSVQITKTEISYQLVYNWVGNAISFKYWDFHWLSLGLARYYKYFGTHEFYQHYDLDKQFVVDDLHVALLLDGEFTAEPLSQKGLAKISDLEVMDEDFKAMKGACILRMICHAMEQENFTPMIKEFLKESFELHVSPLDLLDFMKGFFPGSVDINIDLFFFDWTEQVGFPLINVTLADNGKSLKAVQRRYILLNDGSDRTTRYTIPLTYTTNLIKNFKNTFPQMYFYKEEEEIKIEFEKPIDWVMFNIQQTGYYRVVYNHKLYDNLRAALCKHDWSGIHETNRAQYIDDLFEYGKTGYFDYNFVLHWLEYLKTETAYTPWKAAFNGFNFLNKHLIPEEQAALGEYILFMTQKVFKTLGVAKRPIEPLVDIYTRNLIVNSNCKYGRKSCTMQIQQLFRDYMDHNVVIPVDMRSAVYCSAMRNTTQEDFDKLFEKMKSETERREKRRLRNGLACTSMHKNVQQLMEYILSDKVPIDEKAEAIKPIYIENHNNVWQVFRMLTKDLSDTFKIFRGWDRIASLLAAVSKYMIQQKEKNYFKQFIKVNRQQFGIYANILDEAYLDVDFNFKFAEGYLKPLRTYLAEQPWKNSVAINFINLFLLALAIMSCVLF